MIFSSEIALQMVSKRLLEVSELRDAHPVAYRLHHLVLDDAWVLEQFLRTLAQVVR